MASSNQLRVCTNVFEIKVEEPIAIYKYNIVIEGCRVNDRTRNSRQILFSEDHSSELITVEHRKVCARLFDALVESQEGFPPRQELFYDMRSSFYSVMDLEISKSEEYSVTLDAEDIFGEDEKQDVVLQALICGCCRFDFKIGFTGRILNTDFALEFIGEDTTLNDNLEIVQFLDVATTQDMILKPVENQPDADLLRQYHRFINFPDGVSYFNSNPKSFQALDKVSGMFGHVYLASGLRKSTKLIQSDSKLSIVVSPKISMFYPSGLLTECFDHNLLSNPRQWSSIEKLIRGCYIFPLHLVNRADNSRLVVSKVYRLSTKSAETQTFERNGALITVADYFADVHQLELEHPNYPLIVCRKDGRAKEHNCPMKRGNEICPVCCIFYPFELCELMDDQRVKTNAMVGEMVSKIIKCAAALPDQLKMRVEDCFKAIGLADSPFMRSAKISVVPKPIEVNARLIQPPTMVYARGNQAEFDQVAGNWSPHRMAYVAPARKHVWAMYAVIRGNCREQFTDEDLKRFALAFLREIRQYGFLIEPVECQFLLEFNSPIEQSCDALRKRMKIAKKHNCEFIMLISNEEDQYIHESLKAYEQQIGIITQNVCVSTAIGASGIGGAKPKWQTFVNIINKTNIKLGGLNYHVLQQNGIIGEKDLFVGFDLTSFFLSSLQPKTSDVGDGDAKGKKKRSTPTILAYASNDSKHSIGFTGDFIFNEAGSHLNAMYDAMVTLCKRYVENRKSIPKRLFVYRSGCSDGQFKIVKEQEEPVIRDAFESIFGVAANLVFVVVNKRHNISMIPAQLRPGKASEQNLPIGTLIDQAIISPLFDEFYLAGHRALQGTTKIPRYVVLSNDNTVTLNELQSISLGLCFAFQIIPSPISLPSPIAVAAEYGKRARNLLNAAVNKDRIDRVEDLVQLTDLLSFADSEQRGYRINA